MLTFENVCIKSVVLRPEYSNQILTEVYDVTFVLDLGTSKSQNRIKLYLILNSGRQTLVNIPPTL